jgi:phosphate transport system substrate-binding protein
MSKDGRRFARSRQVVLALACFLVHPKVRAAEVIRIGSTGSALGLIRILASAFEGTHPGMKTQVAQNLGSSAVIKALDQRALDIGLISRDLTSDEHRLGLQVSEYAKTPFILIAGKNVPISSLRLEELIKIYTGEARQWTNGERIRLVLRPVADADTLLARAISTGMNVAVDTALSRPGLVVALTNQEALEIVERTAGSICFSSLSQVRTENSSLKILSFNGIQPNLMNLKNGTYPLFLKFSIVTAKDSTPSVRDFIEFLHSPAGQDILEKFGNVPIKN